MLFALDTDNVSSPVYLWKIIKSEVRVLSFGLCELISDSGFITEKKNAYTKQTHE